jgi:hypothetical protein
MKIRKKRSQNEQKKSKKRAKNEQKRAKKEKILKHKKECQ